MLSGSVVGVLLGVNTSDSVATLNSYFGHVMNLV